MITMEANILKITMFVNQYFEHDFSIFVSLYKDVLQTGFDKPFICERTHPFDSSDFIHGDAPRLSTALAMPRQTGHALCVDNYITLHCDFIVVSFSSVIHPIHSMAMSSNRTLYACIVYPQQNPTTTNLRETIILFKSMM